MMTIQQSTTSKAIKHGPDGILCRLLWQALKLNQFSFDT